MISQGSMAYRAAQAYRSASITVPPLRAVVLLLDGAIAALQLSIVAYQARRFEDSHQQMTRATTILRGLSHHLDTGRGGTIAGQMFTTYNALILACLRSFGRPAMRSDYLRVIDSLADLRSSWDAVAAGANQPVGSKLSVSR